jgi:hypothetical protein
MLGAAGNNALKRQMNTVFSSHATHLKSKQSCLATRNGGAWGERKYISYSLLTSALDRGEWSASRSGCALPRDGGGGWVGLRAGLDTEVRGKILCFCRGSNLDRPVVQPVARHYTD